MTIKWTCDHAGNWRQVPVTLERKGAGWTEVVVAGATATQQGRAA